MKKVILGSCITGVAMILGYFGGRIFSTGLEEICDYLDEKH